MSKAKSQCTFCELVDYLAKRGMIDEYDREIIARHIRQEHDGLKETRADLVP